MNSKIFSLLLVALICVGITQAQQIQVQEIKPISFDKTTHEFGAIEKNDKAETTFTFTNVSKEPVTLSNVKASCGCTTPQWTKAAVGPGETGEIQVRYNTSRVGPFTKSVTVTYNPNEKPVVLYIKGKVNQPASAEPVFPNVTGALAFDRISSAVGILDSDKESKVVFQAQNVGPKPIRFADKQDHEAMFEVAIADQEIIPGQKTTITVTVKGDRFITPGGFSKKIYLRTNEAVNPEKELTISGELNKVLSAEELAARPNIEFEKMTFDGGNVIEGEKVEYVYSFTNTGKQDLVIESVKASCGCTATAPKDKVIKSGESSEIVATFDSRGRTGKQNKSITVKSNDPDESALVLRFSVEVVKDPFHVGGNEGGFSPVATPGGGK